MLYKTLVLFFIFCLISAKTLYHTNPDITELTVKTFGKVKTGVWLVQFYAHWCPHCKHFVPVYANIAKQLKGIANVGAVNAVMHRTEIPVTTVPALKLFINGKKIDYKGAKTAKNVVAFVKAQIKANP